MLMPQGDNSICRISKTCRHSGPRCLATGPTIEPWRDLFPSSCADCQIVVVMLGNWQTSECKSWLLAVLLAVAVTPHGHPHTHTHTRGPHCFKLGFRLQQSSAKWRVLATASKHPFPLPFLPVAPLVAASWRRPSLHFCFCCTRLFTQLARQRRDGAPERGTDVTATYSVVLFVLSHSLCNVLSLCVSSFSQVGTV